jgi:hypothetical protein
MLLAVTQKSILQQLLRGQLAILHTARTQKCTHGVCCGTEGHPAATPPWLACHPAQHNITGSAKKVVANCLASTPALAAAPLWSACRPANLLPQKNMGQHMWMFAVELSAIHLLLQILL